jgi:putative Mg2+ transporter-C (MgtC) family protein
METDLTLTIVARILLAGVLGGLIGIERTRRGKAAGLRTNMFICGGTALFTVMSIEFGDRFGGDHARIAAQLIPGIGFIGAGAILRDQGSVVGLTTAATIFVVASVGMTVGAGLYATAVFVTGLIVFGLAVLGWAEARYIARNRLTNFRVTTSDVDTALDLCRSKLEGMNVQMRSCHVRHDADTFSIELSADLLPKQQEELLIALARCQAVSEADAEALSRQ